MMATDRAGQNSFVLLRIGNRRVALPAGIVAELAPPVRLHTFPHSSPLVAGVILRRNRIVPVYDAGLVLAGKGSSGQRFYLIARRQIGETSELGAIPVNGECELATGEMRPPEIGRPAYVAGTLSIAEESLDVLNLEAMIAWSSSGANKPNRTAAQS
jgi:chemotaxis signal transduction protein